MYPAGVPGSSEAPLPEELLPPLSDSHIAFSAHPGRAHPGRLSHVFQERLFHFIKGFCSLGHAHPQVSSLRLSAAASGPHTVFIPVLAFQGWKRAGVSLHSVSCPLPWGFYLLVRPVQSHIPLKNASWSPHHFHQNHFVLKSCWAVFALAPGPDLWASDSAVLLLPLLLDSIFRLFAFCGCLTFLSS